MSTALCSYQLPQGRINRVVLGVSCSWYLFFGTRSHAFPSVELRKPFFEYICEFFNTFPSTDQSLPALYGPRLDTLRNVQLQFCVASSPSRTAMRETRAHTYAPRAVAAQFPGWTVPGASAGAPQDVAATATAGFVGDVSWRFSAGDGRNQHGLLFECSGVEHARGARLLFPAPLLCAPLVTGAPGGARDVVVIAPFWAAGGCELVRILVRVGEGCFEELGRVRVDAVVTCVIPVGAEGLDVAVGLADGGCGSVRFSAPLPRFERFEPPPPDREPGAVDPDDTSMVSAEEGSRLSVASSMSRGLINRFFGTPAPLAPPPSGAIVQDSSAPPAVRSARHSSRLSAGPRDPVSALAIVRLPVPALIALHQSGRLCVYVSHGQTYNFAGEGVLPVELAKSKASQFLLTGTNGSAVAVLTVDEDPRADSVRVFNITAKLRVNRTVVLSCTQIAKRDGPIDRLVGAVFTGDDVIVGTEDGAVAALLNGNDAQGPGAKSGLPTGTLWTAVDDVDKAHGLGRSLDGTFVDPRERLLSAHRFSSTAIAKAVRAADTDAAIATRAEVERFVRTATFGDDEDAMFTRIMARAERHTRTSDMCLHGISVVPDVGIVISRHCGVYVLRALFEPERRVLGATARLVNDRHATASGRITLCLASQAATQIVATCLSTCTAGTPEQEKLQYMLGIAARMSEVLDAVPLTDRIALALMSDASGSDVPILSLDLPSAVARVLSILEPSSATLSFLHSASEMKALALTAEQTANSLPISSLFASGISWLAQYRSACAVPSRMDTDIDFDHHDATDSLPDGVDPTAIAHTSTGMKDVLLERAYGFLLTAAESCEEQLEDSASDVSCVMSLAGLVTGREQADLEMQDDDNNSPETTLPVPVREQVPLEGVGEEALRRHLSFWLMERSVRLLEGSGSPRTAAAAALVAMMRAPDRQRYETMRAAAFGRFLDGGQLEHALTALLKAPFHKDVASLFEENEAGALRDALGLFVNAAADRGRLQWLADCDLPEPLKALAAMSLERRARASDPMHIDAEAISGEVASAGFRVVADGALQKRAEYEHLYAWQILRGDEAGAATCALEWADRLCTEGLALVRGAFAGRSAGIIGLLQLRLLLLWARTKCQALSSALAAAQLQPHSRRFIARSRFSILAQEPSAVLPSVVDIPWVSRRHLLAHAQSRCLMQMVSGAVEAPATAGNPTYLLEHGSTLLTEQQQGVNWVVGALETAPSYENLLLCSELTLAWVPEHGDSRVVDVIRAAARAAASRSAETLTFPELDNLLKAVTTGIDSMRSRRNWHLVAVESALAASAGAVALPQWLIDAAAWGSVAFACGTTVQERMFSGRGSGDAAGVARALLRYNRPVDAARVLLAGLQAGDSQRGFYVPYAAVDATLETLAQIEEDYPDATDYRHRLEASAQAHIATQAKMAAQTDMAMT